MPIIKRKIGGQQCFQGCGEIGTLIPCWWECEMWNDVSPYGKHSSYCGNSLADPQKVACIITTWPRNCTPKSVSERFENICSYKSLCVIIAALVITAKKGTRPNLHQLMNRERKFYIATQRNNTCPWEGMNIPCDNMDKPWKHCAQLMKPDIKSHMLYDSMYLKCPE
jgi:hypothetical protein